MRIRQIPKPTNGMIGNNGALKVPGTLSPFLRRMMTEKFTIA
jgi:hypothetical protein